MKFSLYGIADPSFMNLRGQVLNWLKDSKLDYSFEECTSLDSILAMGIRDIPCLMMNNQIIEFNSFRGSVNELKLRADRSTQTPIHKKKVMVAMDLSPKGLSTFNYAKQFATDQNYGIDIIHIIDPGDSETPGKENQNPEIDSKEAEQKIVQFISDQSDFSMDWEKDKVNILVRSGCPVERLIEHSMQNSYSIIFMSWDPASPLFSEYLHGHSTGALIQFSNVPLVIIPEGFKYDKPLRFILPVDDLSTQGRIEKGIRHLQSIFKLNMNVRLKHPGLHRHLQAANEGPANGLVDIFYFEPDKLLDQECGFQTGENLENAVLVIKSELFSQENFLKIPQYCLENLPVLFLNESRFTKTKTNT